MMGGTTGSETTTICTKLDPSYPLAILYPSGCMDEGGALPLLEAIHGVIDDGYRDIVVEMSRTDGATGAFISALMRARSRFGSDRGRIVLAGPASLTLLPGGAPLPQELASFPDVEAARATLFQVSERQLAPMRENTVRLRTWLRTLTAPLNIEIGDRERIEAAASEAFANAVQHATPQKDMPLHIRVALGSVVLVEVHDRGAGFQARQYFTVNPALLHTGARGLGIYVMRHLMDAVEFVSGGGESSDSETGTIVRLVKRLKRGGEV